MTIPPPLRVQHKTTKIVRLSLLAKMRECEQVAAVCYRIRRGAIEFLLVQTRGTKRWIFPKGGAERGLSHAQAAAIEAFEEAGVHGTIEEAAFARYKQRRQNSTPNAGIAAKVQLVSAHLCEVRRLGNPKEPNRNRTWFSVEETIRRLREGRKTGDGNEFARVLQLAVTRIEYLNNTQRTLSNMQPRPIFHDELHKVQFEAFSEVRSPLAPSRRLALSASRMRAIKIVPCEVLQFAAPPNVARNQRLLSGATKFKAPGTGLKSS